VKTASNRQDAKRAKNGNGFLGVLGGLMVKCRVLWHRLVLGEHPVVCGWCPTLGRPRPKLIRWSPVANSTGLCPECKAEVERKEEERDRQLKRGVMSILEATEEWTEL